MSNISQSVLERLNQLELGLLKLDRINQLYEEEGHLIIPRLINYETPSLNITIGDLDFWGNFEIHLNAVETIINITDEGMIKNYALNRCINMSKLYHKLYKKFETYKDTIYKYIDIRNRKNNLNLDFTEE